MLPEEREMLERTAALAEDNNKMLHAMRRSMFWSRVMGALYWIAIIGISIGAFYFIQPYVDKVMKLYNSVSGVLNNLPK